VVPQKGEDDLLEEGYALLGRHCLRGAFLHTTMIVSPWHTGQGSHLCAWRDLNHPEGVGLSFFGVLVYMLHPLHADPKSYPSNEGAPPGAPPAPAAACCLLSLYKSVLPTSDV
jgi:hypothetical protein